MGFKAFCEKCDKETTEYYTILVDETYHVYLLCDGCFDKFLKFIGKTTEEKK